MKKFKISDHKQSFSYQRQYQASSPVSTALLEKSAGQVLRKAGQLVAVDGIIPGHLKLLIKSGDSGLILSMTRPDNIDRTCIGQWTGYDFIGNYDITINFNLLMPAAFSEDELLGALQPEKIADIY